MFSEVLAASGSSSAAAVRAAFFHHFAEKVMQRPFVHPGHRMRASRFPAIHTRLGSPHLQADLTSTHLEAATQRTGLVSRHHAENCKHPAHPASAESDYTATVRSPPIHLIDVPFLVLANVLTLPDFALPFPALSTNVKILGGYISRGFLWESIDGNSA
jgi:hypothetical protein